MQKEKEYKKIYEELIRRYYNDEYDPLLSEQSTESFMRWLSSDENIAEQEEIFRELFDNEKGLQTDDSLDRAKTQELVEKIKLKYGDVVPSDVPTKKVSLPLRRVMLRVAAVVVPAMVIGGGYWFATRNNATEQSTQVAEITAQNGETITESLPDSTKVWVNAGGKLTVTESKTQRVAQLSGESYFEVAKDEQRPFIVKTQDLTVTVLGTEFNVEAYPDSDLTIVTLDKGSVAIKTTNNQSYTLEPNQQFVYSRTAGMGEVKTIEIYKTQEAAQWKQGVLVLDRVTLSEAFKAIERRYNVSVEIAAGVNVDEVVMCKFEKDATLDDVIRRISIVIPAIGYSIEDNKLIISQK